MAKKSKRLNILIKKLISLLYNYLMNKNVAVDRDLDPANMLKWYIECGVNETISNSEINWFEENNNIVINQQVNENTSIISKRSQKPAVQPPLTTNKEIIENAEKLAAASTTLDELKAAILSFDGCSLKKTASNTVFSDGNPKSDIMLIGEAPGAEEDRTGKPFVGEAGQLLDKMFAAVNMTRKDDFYVANVLPWRPPGNRKPTEAECNVCLPFLRRHIELFDPKMIILIGGTSASALLNVQTGITKLRGKWLEYSLGEQKIPIMPIFHPAYLLRQPHFKKQTWHDLLSIKEKIGRID